MVLSFQQYKQRHSKQLAGLTDGQKAKKYKAYVNAQGRSTRAVAAPKAKKSGAPKSRAVGKALAETAASFLPGPLKVLSPLAGEVGGFLGEGIGTLLGLGDYKVKKNSIVSEGNSPAFMHSKNGSIFVRHREFVTNIYSSPAAGNFSVQNFPIQPGLSTTMPWLSPLTRGFQEWQPHGIVFEFKSNTGMISSAATPSIGMVIMATDYDAFDTNPFQNKVDMENTQYTTNAKATESFYHPVECAYNKNILDRLFLRNDSVPDNQPPQFYDLGTFAIASVGTPVAGQNLGELWVTYDIELMKPTMKHHDGGAMFDDLFSQPSPLTSKELFAHFTPGFNNSINGTCSLPDTNVARYTFSPNTQTGSYDFTFLMEHDIARAFGGTSPNITCVACSMEDRQWITSNGGDFLQPIFADGDWSVYGAPNFADTSQFHCWTWRINVHSTGAYVQFDMTNTNIGGTIDAGLLRVSKVNRDNSVNESWPPPPKFGLPSRHRQTETEKRRLVAERRGERISEPDREDLIAHLQQQLDELKGGEAKGKTEGSPTAGS